MPVRMELMCLRLSLSVETQSAGRWSHKPRASVKFIQGNNLYVCNRFVSLFGVFLGEQKVNLLTDGNQVFLFPLNCVIIIFYTVVLYFIATVSHIFLTNSNIHVLYISTLNGTVFCHIPSRSYSGGYNGEPNNI